MKKSNPWTPYAFASPNSDFFHPPNEWYATGTGMGTLMPIIPTCTSDWNRRAAPPSLVKIAVPLPNSPELMSARPSSYLATRTTDRTGPKISSVYAFDDVGTWSSRVGPKKKPSSCPGTVNPRPSTTTVAPSASAMST